MEWKCHQLAYLWPISGCNAAYWAMAIAALVFIYQFHRSATALYSQLEKNCITSTDFGSGSASSNHRLPFPNGLGLGLDLSLRTWRVATFLFFLSQTFLAIFAARFTFSWIQTLREWASRQENGSRPVIILNALLLCIWILCILHLLGRGYISLIQSAMLFYRMGKLEKFRHDIDMHLPSPSSPPSCGRNAIEKIRVETPSGSLV